MKTSKLYETAKYELLLKMFLYDDERNNKELLIFLIGSIVFLMLPFMFSTQISDFKSLIQFKIFQEDIIGYILLLLFFYFSYFYIIPHVFFRKKYILFFIIIFLTFIIVTFLPKFLTEIIGMYNILDFQNPGRRPHGGPFMKPPKGIIFIYGRFAIVYFVVLSAAYILRLNERLKQSEKEKLNAELSFLKAQINPHFLFNTLNSIYALSIDKSDETPDAVIKLSGLMRYVITETQHDTVLLTKEIQSIADYIDLQKIRLANTATIDFITIGITDDVSIAPMLLLPYIENTFKYGISSEEHSQVVIHIDCKEGMLNFHTENTIYRANYAQDEQYKIGHKNTKHRLELIYPDRHSLTTEIKDKKSLLND